MDILLVEDDLSLQMVTKDFLEDNGYTVQVCGTGSGAIEIIKKFDMKLVVLDINLPDLTGFDICRLIRKESNIPIIFLSARIDDTDKIKGLELGGDDYIMKPYSLNELLYRIKAQLRRRYEYDSDNGVSDKGTLKENGLKTADAALQTPINEMNAQKYQFGNVVVNFSARKVFVNGDETDLPPKEFDLLVYFINNRNKSISKEVLYNSIWGFDSMGEINTLSVHIRRLREKIEDDPSEPRYIKTIWGVGFRFEV